MSNVTGDIFKNMFMQIGQNLFTQGLSDLIDNPYLKASLGPLGSAIIQTLPEFLGDDPKKVANVANDMAKESPQVQKQFVDQAIQQSQAAQSAQAGGAGLNANMVQ